MNLGAVRIDRGVQRLVVALYVQSLSVIRDRILISILSKWSWNEMDCVSTNRMYCDALNWTKEIRLISRFLEIPCFILWFFLLLHLQNGRSLRIVGV